MHYDASDNFWTKITTPQKITYSMKYKRILKIVAVILGAAAFDHYFYTFITS